MKFLSLQGILLTKIKLDPRLLSQQTQAMLFSFYKSHFSRQFTRVYVQNKEPFEIDQNCIVIKGAKIEVEPFTIKCIQYIWLLKSRRMWLWLANSWYLVLYEQMMPHLEGLCIGINLRYKPNFYFNIYLGFQYNL